GQVIVEPDRRNRDDEAERRFDERFRDAGRDRAETARAGGRDALERGDDADDRAEQSDEGRGGADGGKRGDALLQVVRGERGRALDGAADRVDQVFTAQITAGFLLELILLQAREDHFGQVAVAVVLGGRDRNRVLQAAFLQVLGHLRRVELRLLAGLRERINPLDRDAAGDHR